MRYAPLLFAAVFTGCATNLTPPPGMSSDDASRAQEECQRDASAHAPSYWDHRTFYQRCLQDKGFQ